MTAPRLRLLIVDDDPLIQETLGFLLRQHFELLCAADRSEAITHLREGPVADLALVDLGLPPTPHRPDEGLNLIGELLDHNPHCKIVVLSGQNELEHARHARTLGALDFIAKPAQPEHLLATLRNAAKLYLREQEKSAERTGTPRPIGNSPALRQALDRLQQFAPLPFPVLVEGESGTGKELAAALLHETRGQGPFVTVNCAAISPGLMEASLFGHARGAYTGAVGAQAGFFEEANRGSLFLDEVGELPLELQPKLLRVLENGEYQRVGETQRRHTAARVICATNRDLAQEVRAGRFRADLYHRLSVLRLRMPALREMGDDRNQLLAHFLAQFAQQMGVLVCRLTPEAQRALCDYDFPGNVRELRNVAIRLLSRHAGREVSATALEAEFESEQKVSETTAAALTDSPAPLLTGDALQVLQTHGSIALDEVLAGVEQDYIAAALHLARGNMSQAARMLGINRSTLYNRLEALSRQGKPLPADKP